jgi:hypothetical protein
MSGHEFYKVRNEYMLALKAKRSDPEAVRALIEIVRLYADDKEQTRVERVERVLNTKTVVAMLGEA